MSDKRRLDVAVFEQGYAPSREKARALIMAGLAYVNNQKADKAGLMVSADDTIEVRGDTLPFVSRGGLKLDKAVRTYALDFSGMTCIDIGASTGGFTDCMLQNGADKVYAVDVGYGQLAWKLRNDERVVNMERTNFRYVTAEQIPEPIDFASIDVAFISLTKILPVLRPLLKANGKVVALIKPQFEAGRENVGKKGVVRDKAVHIEVVKRLTDNMLETGYTVLGLSFSPIRGPEGNIEYLAYLEKSETPEFSASTTAEAVVEASHAELD